MAPSSQVTASALRSTGLSERSVILKPEAVERDDLAVVQVDDAGGAGDEGHHVAAEEHLALADADDEGAAVAGPDDASRLVGVDDRDAVGALEVDQGGLDGRLEVALVVLGDEVGYDLGVGLAIEDDALLARASRGGRDSSR